MSFVWSDDNVARLQELHAQDLSAAQVGAEMGISRNAVIGKLHRLAGYVPTNPRFVWTDERMATLREMRAAGAPAHRIGAVLGISEEQVHDKCRAAGIAKAKKASAPKPRIRVRAKQAPKPRTGHTFSHVKRGRPTPADFAAYAQEKAAGRRFAATLDLPTEATAAFGDGGCRWPMWPDDRRKGNLAEIVICGRVRDGERPYCPQHYRLAYRPVPERRQAA